MGRKIPGKKHRKVVEPENQRAKREASLKDKINKAPKNPDEQEIPKSAVLLTRLKEKTKLTPESKGKTKRKRGKRNLNKQLCVKQFLEEDEFQPGMTKPEKCIPNLVQRPQETVEGFYKRVNSMTKEIIKEAQLEDKFGAEIKKGSNKGKTIKTVKNVRTVKSRKKKEETVKLSLKQKREEKKQKIKRKDDGNAFGHLKDKVEFGEVVHRPPVNLKSLKKSNKCVTSKANKYKDLLLHKLTGKKNKSKKDQIQSEKEERQKKLTANAHRRRKKTKN